MSLTKPTRKQHLWNSLDKPDYNSQVEGQASYVVWSLELAWVFVAQNWNMSL